MAASFAGRYTPGDTQAVSGLRSRTYSAVPAPRLASVRTQQVALERRFDLADTAASCVASGLKGRKCPGGV